MRAREGGGDLGGQLWKLTSPPMYNPFLAVQNEDFDCLHVWRVASSRTEKLQDFSDRCYREWLLDYGDPLICQQGSGWMCLYCPSSDWFCPNQRSDLSQCFPKLPSVLTANLSSAQYYIEIQEKKQPLIRRRVHLNTLLGDQETWIPLPETPGSSSRCA